LREKEDKKERKKRRRYRNGKIEMENYIHKKKE
jgi:hypothetical protein